jgi:hypothetical protein
MCDDHKATIWAKSWKKCGLKKLQSTCSGKIAIDPTNSILFNNLAAYGPLWNSGAKRHL